MREGNFSARLSCCCCSASKGEEEDESKGIAVSVKRKAPFVAVVVALPSVVAWPPVIVVVGGVTLCCEIPAADTDTAVSGGT